MSGSIVSASINSFLNPTATPPEKLHHLGRAFGLLSSVRQEEDCQIAQIGNRLLVLPADLHLSEYLGHRIGLMRYEDRFLIRRANDPQEARSS
jgi:hypothetical protein